VDAKCLRQVQRPPDDVDQQRFVKALPLDSTIDGESVVMTDNTGCLSTFMAAAGGRF
jgi:hypothetical protein